MLIAVISVLHVLVSHYAVGGGLFLAVETQYANRPKNPDYLAYLKDHAWFFILVTVVYGAITGVGIWWTIGLASPLATETLIHVFVFGWAIEYVVLHDRDHLRLHLLLFLGIASTRRCISEHRLDLRQCGLDEPGDHNRHHRLHAPPGELAENRRPFGRGY